MKVSVIGATRLSARAVGAAVQAAIAAAVVTEHYHARAAISALEVMRSELAVCDLDTEDIDGLDYVPEIVNRNLAARTIIISARRDYRTISILRKWPIDGFLDASHLSHSELVSALVKTLSTRSNFSETLRILLNRAHLGLQARNLSPREELVLSILGTGADNHEAAARLGLSTDTVRSHRSQIMRKLSIHHKGELIIASLRLGYTRVVDGGVLHPGFENAIGRIAGEVRDDQGGQT